MWGRVWVTMSSMKHMRHDERGSAMTVALIVTLSVLSVAAAVFAGWAYMSRQDYKNNVQQKVAVAVQANTKKVQADDAAAYAEEAKKPLKPYNGSSAYGSVSIQYPKTWSSYLQTNDSSRPINFYAHPDIVPGTEQRDSSYALRVQVVAKAYDAVLKEYTSAVQKGSVKVSPYALPKNPSTVGARLEGQLTQTIQGKMVVLPLRDKTLKIWTESDKFYADFEQIILPNASFVP